MNAIFSLENHRKQLIILYQLNHAIMFHHINYYHCIFDTSNLTCSRSSSLSTKAGKVLSASELLFGMFCSIHFKSSCDI